MRKSVRKSLEGLSLEEIKDLKLGPGVSSDKIVEGTHLFEPINGNVTYRGLVIHKSRRGTKVITAKRSSNGTTAILLHHISLRHYDVGEGSINDGSRAEAYFQQDPEYDFLNQKLEELKS